MRSPDPSRTAASFEASCCSRCDQTQIRIRPQFALRRLWDTSHNRRAWLFSATPAGAHASALIYSLIETARANGVEPYAWLAHVLRRIATVDTDDIADHYEALMPWNFHPGK